MLHLFTPKTLGRGRDPNVIKVVCHEGREPKVVEVVHRSKSRWMAVARHATDSTRARVLAASHDEGVLVEWLRDRQYAKMWGSRESAAGYYRHALVVPE